MAVAATTPRLWRVEAGGAHTLYDLNDGVRSYGLFIRTPGGYVPIQAGTGGAPPVQTISTRFGACIPQFKPGSTTVAGSEADVVATFGRKSMIRRFNGVPTSTAPTKTTGASGNHVSWSFGIAVKSPWTQAQLDSNTAMAQAIINGQYDTQLAASVANLDPSYFFVEVLHELDTKVNGNFLPLALGQQVKAHAYNVFKAANSDLKVVATYQAFGFSDTNSVWTSGTFASRYGSIPCDVVGLDFDGIAPPTDGSGNYVLPYPTLQSNRMQNAQAWANARGIDWSVPEWGTLANAVAADSDNQILADTFITYLGQQWINSSKPPLYACWYNYGPNPEAAASTLSDLLSQPASIGALSSLVASSVTLAA